VDCTVGTGGHAELLLQHAPGDAVLIGIDLDEENLRITRQHLSQFGRRVRLFHANFSDLGEVLDEADVEPADVVLADLGACSTQLDDPERGLSFQVDGPLDMRFDPEMSTTAEDLVNKLSEKELADLIYAYGGERYSRRIARAIVAARKRERIERTTQLGRIVVGAIPSIVRRRRRGVHPATRTFQALRIAVNHELRNLEKFLDVLPEALSVGGRAGIISFHSLEDQRVKRCFADWIKGGSVRSLTRKPITPTTEEMATNPRSRSGKLRGIEKLR